MKKFPFKKLIKLKRCIAIADGFYEWKRTEKEKNLFFQKQEQKNNLFYECIYDENEFCLITEQASENLLAIHHRQPVILNQKDLKVI